jgi:predicted ATPase
MKFKPDEITGHPHLEARYDHHRPNAGWQREDQFSDGTLRLLGLLWSLLEGDSLLLLEEPELSLNDAIVEQIPLMMQRIQRTMKYKRQIFISTHSEALLSNKGIDGRGILLLETLGEGTRIRPASEEELQIMEIGMSPSEVLLSKVRPKTAEQLGMFE